MHRKINKIVQIYVYNYNLKKCLCNTKEKIGENIKYFVRAQVVEDD